MPGDVMAVTLALETVYGDMLPSPPQGRGGRTNWLRTQTLEPSFPQGRPARQGRVEVPVADRMPVTALWACSETRQASGVTALPTQRSLLPGFHVSRSWWKQGTPTLCPSRAAACLVRALPLLGHCGDRLRMRRLTDRIQTPGPHVPSVGTGPEKRRRKVLNPRNYCCVTAAEVTTPSH